MNENKTNINWFPGHMTKTMRELENRLKNIDVVIEVLDARAPGSTRNPDFDILFSEKKRIIILNKEDLADRNVTKEWIDHFSSEGIRCLSYSVIKSNTVKPIINAIEDVSEDIVERYKNRGVNKIIRVLVCGIPNVGKSALLNKLLGQKKLKEGNKPGVTRGLSWVKINDYIECMDSPGLLWPKFENQKVAHTIALIGSIRQEILEEEELAYYLINLLKSSNPSLLEDKYNVEVNPKSDTLELMESIGRKRGFLLKQGVIDMERTSRLLLDDFKNGRLGVFSFERP